MNWLQTWDGLKGKRGDDFNQEEMQQVEELMELLSHFCPAREATDHTLWGSGNVFSSKDLTNLVRKEKFQGALVDNLVGSVWMHLIPTGGGILHVAASS